MPPEFWIPAVCLAVLAAVILWVIAQGARCPRCRSFRVLARGDERTCESCRHHWRHRITITFLVLFLAAAGRGSAADDALDEVNRARAARGLRPFVKDAGLSQAAAGAADYRASRLIAGHTTNDFAFVPPGSSARAAGCAAWRPEWGWGACCTYERWTYAGAAVTVGRDGRRYMHLFVR